jgi:hypothetical protein
VGCSREQCLDGMKVRPSCHVDVAMTSPHPAGNSGPGCPLEITLIQVRGLGWCIPTMTILRILSVTRKEA